VFHSLIVSAGPTLLPGLFVLVAGPVDQRVLLGLDGLDHRLIVEQGRRNPPLQVALALRVVPVPVAVDVVEPGLAQHVDAGREAVGLPVRGADRHLDPCLAQRRHARRPVLVLQFEAEPHLVLRADRLIGVGLEVLGVE
jgi:hypothetical protein